MTTAFSLLRIDITYGGDSVEGIVYAETGDGAFVISVKSDKPWADDLLASEFVTVDKGPIHVATTTVTATEATGELRASLWKDHIKQLRPGRSGSHRPDPTVRLIVLTPTP